MLFVVVPLVGTEAVAITLVFSVAAAVTMPLLSPFSTVSVAAASEEIWVEEFASETLGEALGAWERFCFSRIRDTRARKSSIELPTLTRDCLMAVEFLWDEAA